MNTDSEVAQPDLSRRGARRRARMRAALLEAAQRVFSEHGYHGATVADITQEADVGVGTFYLYFRDKDDALATLLREGLFALRNEMTRAVAALPPERTIPAVIRTILQFAFAQRELFRIALTGGGQYTPAHAAQERLVEYLLEALTAAQAAGLLSADDLTLLAHFITGMISQGIVWWFSHEDPLPEAMADHILRLLRVGLPAPLLDEGVESR